MWFDGKRQPNTIYLANTSRGKDSTAMLRAIHLMGWPLDMICSVDIWFDEETPAELPPMVAFKDEYDRKVLEQFGVPVTRLCATKRERLSDCSPQKLTYCDIFYRTKTTPKRERERESGTRIPADQGQLVQQRSQTGRNLGFPNMGCPWCTGELKRDASKVSHGRKGLGVQTGSKGDCSTTLSNKPRERGAKINIVHYIGIAADEPLRIKKHIGKKDCVLPLVQMGWDEDLCGLEATYMDMLSPTYTDGQMRDGCWFCHNQGIGQLRRLRKLYPELWAKLMQLDLDSPVTFHPDGHTVHDFDRRFSLEDEGLIDPAKPFRWKMLDDELQYSLF